MLFENLSDEKTKNKKLSFAEKAIILTGYGVGRLLLKKLKKAKTYGDLQFIANSIENAVDNNETCDDEATDESVANLFKELEQKFK